MKIDPAENNLPRQSPAFLKFPDHHQLIIFLQYPASLRVMKNLQPILQHRDLGLWIHPLDQQRIIDVLWTDVLHRLRWIEGLHFVAAHHEAILWRNPQLELLPVAHHVERRGPHNGHQPNEVQHSRLAGQHIAANLLVVGDVPLPRAARDVSTSTVALSDLIASACWLMASINPCCCDDSRSGAFEYCSSTGRV